jgi:hypothetical protein
MSSFYQLSPRDTLRDELRRKGVFAQYVPVKRGRPLEDRGRCRMTRLASGAPMVVHRNTCQSRSCPDSSTRYGNFILARVSRSRGGRVIGRSEMTLSVSRRLAVVIGVLLPLAETVRRWPLWDEYPPAFLDDFLIGAFLLYGAWRCSRDPVNGRIVLAAAWSFACGIGYGSFFAHIRYLETPDPSGIPHIWVATILGVGWILCILGLITTIRSTRGSIIAD